MDNKSKGPVGLVAVVVVVDNKHEGTGASGLGAVVVVVDNKHRGPGPLGLAVVVVAMVVVVVVDMYTSGRGRGGAWARGPT